MLRFLGTMVLIIISMLFQSTIIPMIPYINTTPNLLLVITFAVGLLRGRDEGLIYGLICGLTMDLVGGNLFGFFGLFYMYIGFLSGFLYQLFDVDVPVIAVIMTIITEFLYHGYIFIFRFVIRGRLDYGSYFTSIILPEMFFTIAAGIILYGIISLSNKALEKYEQRSALKFV